MIWIKVNEKTVKRDVWEIYWPYNGTKVHFYCDKKRKDCILTLDFENENTGMKAYTMMASYVMKNQYLDIDKIFKKFPGKFLASGSQEAQS